MMVVIAWAAFRLAETRSVVLFLDADGVWVHTRVLPWARGVVGIRYRDLDDPVMRQSLASWLLRSHTIVLRHCFSSRDAIELDNMRDVPAALERIFCAQRDVQGQGPATDWS
ncbi:MAG: hypothetical protein H6716_24090 [Polyangiaceae bacterium]|nr:hypothetical protein [Polyangiaceae bacterium]